MNTELQKLSVRIRNQNCVTIGSGILYITERQDCAYVITAAHVFDDAEYPVSVQCYPDEDAVGFEEFCFSVGKEAVIYHNRYLSASSPAEKEQYDIALVRLPWMEWMGNRAAVYFDQAHTHLKVEGFGYPANSTREDICLDVIDFTPDESKITNTSRNSRCMVSILKGNFEINHANRAQEVTGFSGSAIAAAEQSEIILVGFAVNIQSVNGLLGRTTLVDIYPAEELLKTVGIECSWKSITEPGQQAARTVISSTRFFVHRESELTEIARKLSQSGTVVLSGMGGIGKTGLARHYASACGSTYTQCAFVPCSDSVASGIAAAIRIDGIQRRRIGQHLESDDQLSQRILDAMRRQPSNAWLLILDDVSPRDPLFVQINELAQHKIITSRWSAQEWRCPVMDISALPDLDDRKDLFQQYLGREISGDELNDFRSIDEIVAGHTLTLQLIALQCAESDMPLSEIRAALAETGIYTDNPDEFAYDGSQVERNMYGHIRAIWNLSNFSDTENRIMQGLSLLAPNGITRREYKQWLQLESMHDINQLRRQGWIQTYLNDGREMIFLHSVVGEVIYRELYEKAPADLGSMLRELLGVVNDRNLDAGEQTRYIAYGMIVGQRLAVSMDAIVLLNLTGLHLEYFRRLDEAIGILGRAQELVRLTNNEQSILDGHTCNNTAVVYHTKMELDTARTYFQQAVEIYRNCGEAAKGNLGYALHNIAKLSLMDRDAEEVLRMEDEAEPLIRQYREAHLGEVYDIRRECHCSLVYRKYMRYDQLRNEPSTSRVLLNELERLIKDHMDKALACGQLAIDYKQQYNGSIQQEIMISVGSHAVNKAHYRQDRQAAIDIQRVLTFFIRSTGERSEHTGQTYNKMCLIHYYLGDLAKACDAGEKAVDILTHCLGDNHEVVGIAKDNLQMARRRHR